MIKLAKREVLFPNLEIAERAEKIFSMLAHYVPNPLPPLSSHSAYTHLIAVLLSARSQDIRVNAVTPQLFTLADTPERMIELSIENIQSIIRPCGLSLKKAQSIWELSQILIQNHQGQVPNTFEELEKLPGVGHKTASVVMTQIFKIPAFPVDTHIQRLAVRWKLSSKKSISFVEKSLRSIFHPQNWDLLHLRMIYYGRIYCVARRHQIKDCPICFFLQENQQFASPKSKIQQRKKNRIGLVLVNES